MQLEHEFTAPMPIDTAWKILLDVERVAPCMPGATLETVTGDEFTGRVTVKVGPVTVTYRGQARFADKDEAKHSVVIEASGKEARGSGTARATVRATLHEEDEATTRAVIETDLAVTGRPAQFGRGVMVEVGNKLIGKFASCLAEELGRPSPDAAGTADAGGAAGAETQVESSAEAGPGFDRVASQTQVGEVRQVQPAEPINLIQTAGIPVLKRVAPLLVGLLAGALLWWWVRRR
jgi:carbon monoxide dehydrogenase subunit G